MVNREFAQMEEAILKADEVDGEVKEDEDDELEDEEEDGGNDDNEEDEDSTW